MPGWHDATKELKADGRILMVGLIQEQHPDRCRLFMQWHEMDWPVLVDAQNLLGVRAVPITVLIDENGMIHAPIRSRSPREIVEAFLAEPALEAAHAAAPPARPDLAALETGARDAPDAASWLALGSALLDWAGATRVDDAVAALERAVELDPADGPAWFRLGVALRKRSDSEQRRPHDFQRAAAAWGRALEIDPNQYIWRRRIEQYGPRLDKPYPFYDWVAAAREAIVARGGTPVPLDVEPRGAELASPSRELSDAPAEGDGPDPDGRITRDDSFMAADVAVVPASIEPGGVVRVHVTLAPRGPEAHWNNESQPVRLRIDPPENFEPGAVEREVENAPAATSREARTIEVELRVPAGAAPGTVMLPAYALYNVCSGADGVCLFRRLDVAIPITIR